jgi:molybdenum cofactor cytidylyltransferase
MNLKTPTAGIILAAGLSRRLGSPKQLVKIKGQTLIEITVDAALGSKLDCVVLVLGNKFEAMLQALGERTKDPRLDIIENTAFREGMSASIRLGLKRIHRSFSSAMFLLGDQPLISSKTIDFLLDRFSASKKDILVPVCRNKKGNPTIFSDRFYNQIFNIKGDMGAREIIRDNPDCVSLVEMDNPALFFDIDTPADLEKLKNHFETCQPQERWAE